MGRKVQHYLLTEAKINKKDEFYTQLKDIENELQYYVSSFKGKTVFCNCDDPRNSMFVHYFVTNFEKLELRRLIASCYKEQQQDLFNLHNSEDALWLDYYGRHDDASEQVDYKNSLNKLKGNGDFRSFECIELLKQADIVVTNPPFSLFREFVEQIIKYNKQFLIIGNINAITYKEIFKLIKNNQAWLGVNLGRGISGFIVPENYELYGTETYIDDHGNRIISPNNCLWLTNVDHSQRHTFIPLTKKYVGNEDEYPLYDNYDGINVNRTIDIPQDYNGVMGVPITFLHKFNPDQFEIVKFREGNDEKDLSIGGKCPYFRILIKKKEASA